MTSYLALIAVILGSLYGGYRIIHKWKDDRLRARLKEAEYKLRKKAIEDQAREDADEDVDNYYDNLGI